MVKRDGRNIYLVRLYRSNGKMEEVFMEAPDDKVALDNAQKSFDREFFFLDNEGDIPVLEEKVNE